VTEFDLPVHLTYDDHQTSSALVTALENAKEQVIWEQRVTEEGTVIVSVLNIVNLEEKADEEES
jgi:hypothetical protein